jgi:hypothetical protein
MTPEQAEKLIPKVDETGYTEAQLSVSQKYSVDGPFNEPVVRCDSCAKLVLTATLKELGMCPHCSNTRVRNARTMNEEDFNKATDWARQGLIDPEWLNLFKSKEVAL